MTLKKNLCAILVLSQILVSCKASKQNYIAVTPSETKIISHSTVPDITEDDIHWHISVLASDSMQGRKAGTPYEALAAGYIKEKFQSLGLKAFGDTYLQPFPTLSNRNFGNCELYFDGYAGVYPADFRPVIMFDSLKIAGEVVFAGYGFDSDYGNLDVNNKWVMIVEGNNSILSDLKTTAKNKGASGVLVIGMDGTSGDERYYLPVDSTPMIRISHQWSDRLFANVGTTVSEILAKTKSDENHSMTIPVIVNAMIKSETQQDHSQNVIACLETNDSGPDSGYIVIGAHYDHIGTQTVNDSIQIFYGADDNASGVAGILEIAEKLCNGGKLKDNIIFVAFGAEEIGLFGSNFFCNNLPVPIEKIKLMVDLDMIGRMDSNNRVVFNTIENNDQLNAKVDEIKDSHPNINLTLALDFYLRGSDHYSFYSKKIPALYFTTGLHNAYHTPADTIGAINFKGAKLLLDFVYDFVVKEAGR